ncbi:MAG: nucleotidyltransferase [Sphingobacteriia bacterium]|nr:MAG: nucleotidyltransferase [Sphingobacteriia bacterium]
MMLTTEDIKTMQNFFTKQPVVKAFLFGSLSRNEATAESDIDILVELDYTQHIGLGFIDMKLDLERQLNKKIDLVSDNSISKHLRPFIDSDKKLIYERPIG